MNGESELSTLSDKVESIDQYEDNILPKNQIPSTLDEYGEYFNMSIKEIQVLSYDEAALIAVRLSQYALFLQRCFNKDKNRSRWLKLEINKIIADKVSQHSGPWSMQEQQAISNNEVASRLQKQLFVIESRLDRMDGVVMAVNKLADQFKNIKYTKGYKK